MIASTLLQCCVRTREVRRWLFRLAYLLAPLAGLAACGEQGVLEPSARSAAVPTSLRSSAVVVTPDYSMFSARSELNGAGTIDHLEAAACQAHVQRLRALEEPDLQPRVPGGDTTHHQALGQRFPARREVADVVVHEVRG